MYRHPLLISLLLFVLASCSTFQGTPPSVRLVDVEMGDVTLFETNLLVKTRIQNESDRTLRLSGTVHKLSLNGVDLGRAVNKESLTIPPLDSRVQQSVFRISNMSVLTRIQRLVEQQALDYSLDSKLYLSQSPFGGSIDLKESGRLLQ